MRRRKLQVFLSSTYEDLIKQRLAAIEAVLGAGHIPAAMEYFRPGDETALQKIYSWIDESDAFILILGGRYGSLEPKSGKSYVQLEYEYALERKKPYFSLVVSEAAHEKRLRQFGSKVQDEHVQQLKAFRAMVLEKHCATWSSKKDIEKKIFQKLPEWAQREDLPGWIRADEATSAAEQARALNEITRLSAENRRLNDVLNSMKREDEFDGISFEDLVKLLKERVYTSGPAIQQIEQFEERWPHIMPGEHSLKIEHAGHLFEMLQRELTYKIETESDDDVTLPALQELGAFNLVTYQLLTRTSATAVAKKRDYYQYSLSSVGWRFRQRLQVFGPLEKRLAELWKAP